jgi:acyl carrier protein
MSQLTLQEIKTETKKLIVETLNMGTVNPEEIRDDIPLLSGENVITIDSIDVIEVVIAIQKKFNVKINDQNLARHIITTVDTIAEFVFSQQVKSGIGTLS